MFPYMSFKLKSYIYHLAYRNNRETFSYILSAGNKSNRYNTKHCSYTNFWSWFFGTSEESVIICWSSRADGTPTMCKSKRIRAEVKHLKLSWKMATRKNKYLEPDGRPGHKHLLIRRLIRRVLSFHISSSMFCLVVSTEEALHSTDYGQRRSSNCVHVPICGP